MSAGRENRTQVKTEVADDIELRKGKWTIEEENYANKIIGLFNQGMLPVVAGTTLRTYLSDKLRCDPMRITKKYAGAACIGKQVFQLSDAYYECFQENERELQRLENLFLLRINGKGLLGKRTGTAEAPTPHQSIYETTNFDQTPSNALQLKRVQKKKTPVKGNKSTADKARKDYHNNYIHGHGMVGDPNYSMNYGYMNGMNGELNMQGDSDEDSDYGYAYDPDQEEQGEQYSEQPNAGAAGGADAATLTGMHSAAPLADGVYSSFRAGGRRVLSAPNLTDLNLSSWKSLDYRPLPADSLKEMFSQPIGHSSSTADGDFHAGGYSLSGTENTSLLPEHVYHTLENGRYSRNTNTVTGSSSGNNNNNNTNGGTAGAAGSSGGAYNNNNTYNTSGSSHSNMMAARARATKAALHQHMQFQYPSHIKDEGYGYTDDGTNASTNNAYASNNGSNFSSLKAKKRSHSAMALVDFEKLAGDDSAAGDLFMQFLDKINNTSSRVARLGTHSNSGSNIGGNGGPSPPTPIHNTTTAADASAAGDSTNASAAEHILRVPSLPSIPSLPASYVPAADADSVLPSLVAASTSSSTVRVEGEGAGADGVNVSGGGSDCALTGVVSAPPALAAHYSQPMEEG